MTSWLALLCLALAGGVPETLQEAGERLARGDAVGAAQAYHAAIRGGVDSADAYYNLGTAALRGGDTGLAVWALMEARARAPWDSDVRFNLALARKANTDTVVGSDDPWWLEVLLAVPRAPVGWLAWLAFLVACGMLVARGVAGPSGPLGRAVAGSLVAAAALVGLCVVVELTAGAPTGVVVVPEAVARGTERRLGPEAFRVHAGLVVRLAAEPRGEVVKIRLSNGLEGYVEATSVRQVKGPPPLVF
jgi:hypothetical protein